MSETIKPRAETRGSRRRAAPESTMANGDHPITLEVMVRLQAIALPEADGGLTVVIPSLGFATQGDTIEQAQSNAIEAAHGWLTSQHRRMTDDAIRATDG